MLNLSRDETDLNLDTWWGAALLLSSTLGTLFNITALSYFKQLKPRNRNGEYFKRLYIVINVTDILIGISAFPSIEALFSENRDGFLLTNYWFCLVWMMHWWMLCMESVLLVATMSLSRLAILRNKEFQFRPGLAIFVPVVFALCSVLMFAICLVLKYMYATYVPQYLVCSFVAFEVKENLTQPITSRMLWTIIGTISVFNLTTSICFVLICGSFIATLVYLKQAAKAAAEINISAKHHTRAARSVVILATLYITFNTPIMAVIGTLVTQLLVEIPELGELTTGHMVKYFFTEPFGTSSRIANHYVVATTNMVFVCLNSALNPIAYYIGIDGFRTYIWRKVNVIVPSSNLNTVNSNSNSARMNGNLSQPLSSAV